MQFTLSLVSAAFWAGFLLYWFKPWLKTPNLGESHEPGTSAESPGSRRFHLVLFRISLVIVLASGIWPAGWRWLPDSWIVPTVGLLLQVAFFVLACLSRRQLGPGWCGRIRTMPDHELITTGIYGYIRHPIYTAILGMFLATMIVTGELFGLIAIPIIGYAYRRKIALEERSLLARFGSRYDEYRRATWALIPWML